MREPFAWPSRYALTWVPPWVPKWADACVAVVSSRPFHGFTYDVAGACVATPFADPPKSARLNVFHTREILGLVFAWWGIDGRPPQWSLPEEPPAEGDWSGMEIQTLRFPGHPQETTENSVDFAHLRYVHGYDDVTADGMATVDGSCLVSRSRLQASPARRQIH